MSTPRYPAYKASGVAWLGDVPDEWSTVRLKQACAIAPSNVDKKSYDGQQSVRLCNYTDVYYNEEITERIEFLAATATTDQVAKFSLKADDVLITKDSETPDDIAVPAYVPKDLNGVVCGYHLALLRPVANCSGRYLKYLFHSRYLRSTFAVAANGLTRYGLSQYALDNAVVPFPPRHEQKAIAAFLDRETTKIDALIAEQERLVALLKEKRQALISHAVTKGLDPNAPMKGSGIEWLGQIPAHWGVLPIKRDIAFITSGSRGWAEHYADDGELFLRIANLTRETLDLDLTDMQRVCVPDGAEGARTKVVPGDVLFSITAYLGSTAVAPAGLESAYVSQHIALMRLHQHRLLPRWVGYVTLSVIGKTYLEAQAYGGTKIQLGLDDVANLPVTAPSREEQAAIIEFLDGAVTKLDALVRQVEGAIELLRERRSALISAAVTGKIDVRNA